MTVPKRGKQWLLALAGLVIGGFILLAYVLWSYHEATWREARADAESHAELIESRFDAALRRVDTDILGIAARIPVDSLNQANLSRFKEQIEPELERHRREFPEIGGFRIVDLAGDVLYKAGDGVYANLEDRAYFMSVRDQKERNLAISPVLTSRIYGRRVVVAARGIYNKEGAIVGMVSAPLDLDYFDRFFNSIKLGEHGAVAIRRADDHTLVLRRPLVPEAINQPLAANHPVRLHIENGEHNGILEFAAQADGVKRIYAYRKLEGYPFYVVAGLAEEDVVAIWRQRAVLVGSISFILLLGLSLLIYWLFKTQERDVLIAERFRRQQEQLKEAQRVARVGSWEFDAVQGCSNWSDEVYQILEINPVEDKASYARFLQAVHPEDRQAFQQTLQESQEKQIPFQMEHRLLMPDGRIKYLLACAETVFAPDGKLLRTVGTMQDLTSVRQMEAQMQLLATAFQYSGEAILITDRENKIVTVNPAFTALTGYTAEEVIGRNPSFLSAGRSSKHDYEVMWNSILEHGFWQGEIWDRRKDGGVYPKWMSVSLIRDEAGEIRYHVAHFSDVSEERAIEAQLHHIAHHDVLTGLLNRLSLKGQLDQALAAARRDASRLAILFIDLDRFKVINDTLGHHVGDVLLIEVAHRLQETVRESDVVARLGGDEFVILLTGVEHSSAVATVAEKLVKNIGDPYLIENHDLYTSPSIGIAIYPLDGEDGDTLMKNADAAMYHAKSAGRNNFQFFDKKMNDAVVERLNLEHSLRHALSNDEFCLHFQPIIDVKSGKVASVEALVRWMHPEQGLISPAKFIPVAEETGLIQPLGEWVFWMACMQLSQFKMTGIHGVKMGINISAMQMRNDNLPILAKGAIEALALDPTDLIFEITESVAMHRPDETIGILNALHGMGIGLAIDDFGTGYSSLSYLKLFPIDHLKVDRSFVIEIDGGPDNATICDATISLGHSLGLELIAEGVETQEQLDYLTGKGCDLVQGFLFSRPLPATEVIEFIKQRNGLH